MRRPAPLHLVLSICLGLASACDPSDGTGDRVGSAPPALSLVAEGARIDGRAENLVPVTAAALGPGGVLALEQRQERRIRLFDAEGRALGVLGGAGSGPGELQVLTGIGWRGDSVWAWDVRQRRVNLYDPARPDAPATVTIPPPLTIPSRSGGGNTEHRGLVTIRAALDDGGLIGRVFERMETGGVTTRYLRIDRSGQVERVIAEYAEPPTDVMIRSPSSAVAVGLPFVAKPLSAPSPDGARLVVVTPHVQGPQAETFHVLAVSAEGDTLFSRSYPFEGVPIPPSVADSIIGERVASARRLDPALAAEYQKVVQVPPFFPPFVDILVDRDDVLWLRTVDRSYLAFDADGHPLGRLARPRGTILAAGGGSVWLLEHDDYDVPSLVRYRLESPG
ncbi:MAG TPA: hypothetical protein VM778_05235 [Gemmatimonadota bacterium]|nr:hypothetical protein [Gemmatimonadota bacterium]